MDDGQHRAPQRALLGQASAPGQERQPNRTQNMPHVGEIRMFAGNFAPAGWFSCQGQLLPIVDYETLFNLIGTTYGGDGVTTFALPDLRGRIPIGAGTLAPSGETFAIGQTGGEEEHTLTTSEMPVHGHAIQVASGIADRSSPSNAVPAVDAEGIKHYSPTADTTMNAAAVGSTGGSGAHNNMQPSLGINFIISLYGVYPSQT